MDPELDPLAAGGLLERIVAWAGQAVGTPNGYICLIEPDSGEMVLRLGTGAYSGLVGLRMLKGEGLSGRVWETGAPLAIPDYRSWEGHVPQMATDAFRAVLGVPLLVSGTVTGVIGLAFSEPGREFSDDEVQQVSRFAEVVSIALDNARLYAAAQQELVERQKAEGRFRTLVEEIPAIVYSEEFEVGGARQYINRQVEPLLGYTPEEAGERNFWKTIVHPDDLERVLAEEARCEQTESTPWPPQRPSGPAAPPARRLDPARCPRFHASEVAGMLDSTVESDNSSALKRCGRQAPCSRI